jgi:polysaccharide biosynthesis protein PslG
MALVLCVVGFGPAFVSPVRSASTGDHVSAKKSCKYVTKKVHGKKKRVKVCSTRKRTSTPTSIPSPTAVHTVVPTGTPVTGGAVRAGGINVSPSYRPWRYAAGPEPDSWWCALPNCYQDSDPLKMINADLGLAKQLGVANVRLEFPWTFIEPQPNSYNWSRADAIVAAARKAGVELQAVLVWAPSWAATAPDGAPTASDFSEFVSAIVHRYAGSIHYWELWNEPDDASKYWSSGVASYTHEILIPGYQAVHAADASAKVILGGAAFADITWFDGIYSNGGGNSFDILAYHDYGGAGGIPHNAMLLQNLLSTHGQGSKPIWLGEYGLQENSIQDAQQQTLIGSVLTSVMPVAMAQWYALRDTYAMDCCSPSIAATGYWGIMQHDGSTAKEAYATMQRLLKG